MEKKRLGFGVVFVLVLAAGLATSLFLIGPKQEGASQAVILNLKSGDTVNAKKFAIIAHGESFPVGDTMKIVVSIQDQTSGENFAVDVIHITTR